MGNSALEDNVHIDYASTSGFVWDRTNYFVVQTDEQRNAHTGDPARLFMHYLWRGRNKKGIGELLALWAISLDLFPLSE